jgi:hypothetical protein
MSKNLLATDAVSNNVFTQHSTTDKPVFSLQVGEKMVWSSDVAKFSLMSFPHDHFRGPMALCQNHGVFQTLG